MCYPLLFLCLYVCLYNFYVEGDENVSVSLSSYDGLPNYEEAEYFGRYFLANKWDFYNGKQQHVHKYNTLYPKEFDSMCLINYANYSAGGDIDTNILSDILNITNNLNNINSDQTLVCGTGYNSMKGSLNLSDHDIDINYPAFPSSIDVMCDGGSSCEQARFQLRAMNDSIHCRGSSSCYSYSGTHHIIISTSHVLD